jgi:hypothetical protein
MDQSLFAAPHGFSQRTTSFIASQRQGIHQMPLRRLIALISQCPDNPDDHSMERSAAPASAGLESPALERPVARICLSTRSTRCWRPGRRAVRPAPPCPEMPCIAQEHPVPRHGKSNPFFTMSKIMITRSPSDRQILSRSMGRPATSTDVLKHPWGDHATRGSRAHRTWWSQTGSNRRPPACKAGALPTELWPRQGTGVRCQASGRTFGPSKSAHPPRTSCPLRVVGLGRLELPTSRLSGVRSNQTELQARFHARKAMRSQRRP